MKKLTRIASAALAAALAVSCTLPVFAAETKPAFQKEETVYAVLEADGSLRSQTVSEHLYSAAGLAAVQDVSALEQIENTQTSAAFTRDGETLVWQTEDTDVYYKGTTSRPLPISAQITYTLDGRTASAAELAGQSGHLVLTIELTNHETGTLTVDGAERAVCTPFITAVGVTLDGSAENVSALHGTLQEAAGSQIAAFVCLPGVRACLDGLLPQQADGWEDYLLDTVTVEADVTDFSAPGVLIACATDTELLGKEGFADLSSLNGLADDMEQLADAMEQLMDGAQELTNGAKALMDGAAQLNDGTQALLTGAAQLKDGAGALENGLQELTGGLDTLAANNDALNAGAQRLADGILATANEELLESGLIAEPLTWADYSARLEEVLGVNDATLAATRKKLLKNIHAAAPQFPDDKLDLALYLTATRTDGDLTAALMKLSAMDPAVLAASLEMKRDPAQAQALIHDCLVQIAETSDDLASVRALKENLDQIAYFVRSVGQYTGGVASAAAGAHSAVDGSAQLAAGTSTLYDGVAALNNGAGSLYSGTEQLHDGTAAMQDGIQQLNDEGISRLTGALSSDQLRLLQALTGEMEDRLAQYRSFGGAPEDASVQTRFILKTAEAPAADNTAAAAEAAAPKLTFWQRLLALFGLYQG